jgi:hypothetical protein
LHRLLHDTTVIASPRIHLPSVAEPNQIRLRIGDRVTPWSFDGCPLRQQAGAVGSTSGHARECRTQSAFHRSDLSRQLNNYGSIWGRHLGGPTCQVALAARRGCVSPDWGTRWPAGP